MPVINYSKIEKQTPSPGDYYIIKKIKHPIDVRLQNPEIPYNIQIYTEYYNKKVGGNFEEEEDKKKYNYDYNIFSGNFINYDDLELNSKIGSIMKELIDILIQFMEAGYHLYTKTEEESVYNRKRIDDWIINFEYPILKMFKLYYGIETSCEDIVFADEFLDNPQFRHMITSIMMKLIVNFANNNSIAFEYMNDYQSISIYKQIQTQL